MDTDYIIVGQGIAGTLLAHHLLQRNKKIVVFNQQNHNQASQFAAGMYNPVTGRKMVKTWLADQLFPYLEKCYQEMELLTGTHFLHPLNIYRPFKNIKEQTEWSSKGTDPEYANFIEKIYYESHYGPDINDAFGGITLKPAGFINIHEFLTSFRKLLIQKKCYFEQYFDIKNLKINDNHITYKEINARKIIFCEGPAGIHSTYFNWMPLQKVKGEFLLIKCQLPSQVIFNRGAYILPVGDQLFKVGATYNNEDDSLEPTEEGKNLLVKKLEGLLNSDYEIIDHQAGIRPASIDRRPLMGLHPEFKLLGIFNGLGSKGVSLGPWFAKEFAAFLDGEASITASVDVGRYFSKAQ